MTGRGPGEGRGAAGPCARRRAAGVLAVLASLVLVACGARLWPGSGPTEAEERLRLAAEAYGDGQFAHASETLRDLARHCENGDTGREAVLLLATLELDPRNPAGSPDAAAQLAARYLQLPSAPSSSRAVAGSLYLVALDRGAEPVRDVLASVPASSPLRRRVRASSARPAPWSVAERFETCETGGGAIPLRSLPDHPDTPWWKMVESRRAELEHRLDSVRADRDSLSARADSLAREADRLPALRQRIDSLEQELGRIRELLPNGSGSPGSRKR